MAADVATPPRLSVSALPTMLMSYFTTTTSSTSTSTSTKNDTLSGKVLPDNVSLSEKVDNNNQNNYAIESLPMTPVRIQETPPRSHATKTNRSSLPLTLGDDDDYASREGSLVSSNGGKSRKRSSRPKTSYSIAHAPPKGSARHKIHVRAKPLLQLHQLSHSSRPMPAYELLPSAIFSPSLSRAISKAFPTRHSLCPADLAIVKAEKYHQHEASSKDEDEARDVLALVCKGRRGDGNTASKAKLFLEDGSEWEASLLPNGGYEFFSTDEHGLGMTARWVFRRPRARRSQSASEMTSSWGPDNSTKKFSFSTISPSSRRHPIIASLTSTSLDINDSYVIPSPLAPSPEFSDHENEDAGRDSVNASLDPVVTSQSLKNLITATAVWVTLREGWCPGYRYDDIMLRSPSLKLNTSPLKSSIEISSAAASKDDTPRRSGSIARLFRSASALKRRSTSSAHLDGSSSAEEPSITRSVSATRARADSTGTVLVHSKRPRGRRANTNSTTASGLAHMDLARNDMTEEEESIETTAATLAKTSKRSSAPTPLIPALDLPETEDEEEHTLRLNSAKSHEAEKKLAETAAQRRKRESSTTSTNSIELGKANAKASPKPKRGKRFRSLFCGMAG